MFWKNQDGVQDGRHKQENSAPGFNILISLRLKCSIYAVNNIKKIILSFDPHVIIMRQDSGQDGCHNHTKSNIFVIKWHSSAVYNSVLCLKVHFCCTHKTLVFGFQLWPHIITTKKDGDQNGRHNYNLKDCVL